ncbi:DUF2742 domain-containing protein [Mycobacterium sp. M23085]|uniref:DUF2742 domain-containing protein n=1 Tax=Mycobacterium sp. M23085 TaxID=3378087 RepID=UPI0038780875
MEFKDRSPGPRDGEGPEQGPAPAQHQSSIHDNDNYPIAANRQIAWLAVHDYINRQRRRLGALDLSGPPLGTPAWLRLSENDPAKLAAVLNAAEAAAYGISASQTAEADASRAIAAAADWPAIAKANRDRAEFIAAHPWAKRVMPVGLNTENTTLGEDARIEAANAENTPRGGEDTSSGSTAENAENTAAVPAATASAWAKRVVA